MVLEALLSIVDRLIALVREQRTIDHDTFVNLVEPLFNRFQAVTEDYIRMFQRLGRNAADAETVEEFRNELNEFDE